MRVSSSEYIAFIDSDDVWLKNKLETQLSFMKKNDFEFTYSDYIFIAKRSRQNNFEKNKLKK